MAVQALATALHSLLFRLIGQRPRIETSLTVG